MKLVRGLLYRLRTPLHTTLFGKYIWHCDLCGMEVEGFLTTSEVERDAKAHHARVHLRGDEVSEVEGAK